MPSPGQQEENRRQKGVRYVVSCRGLLSEKLRLAKGQMKLFVSLWLTDDYGSKAKEKALVGRISRSMDKERLPTRASVYSSDPPLVAHCVAPQPVWPV